MRVKIYNKSNNELPKYKTVGAAGMDARASFSNIDPKDLIKYGPIVYTLDTETKKIKSISMQPGSRVLVPLDIHTSIPEGYMIGLYIRSGLALKEGLLLGNSMGVIDYDFRGNYGAILVNPSWNKSVDIAEGDRICQLILQKVENIEWEEVDSFEELDKTDRGIGGFGSTGKQ